MNKLFTASDSQSEDRGEISSSFSWPVSAVPACQEMPVEVGMGERLLFYVNAQQRREQPCMGLADRKMRMAPRNGSSASIKFPGWKQEETLEKLGSCRGQRGAELSSWSVYIVARTVPVPPDSFIYPENKLVTV